MFYTVINILSSVLNVLDRRSSTSILKCDYRIISFYVHDSQARTLRVYIIFFFYQNLTVSIFQYLTLKNINKGTKNE